MPLSSHCRRATDNGFAFVELLVVIVVIGVLAGIAIPAFLRQRARAFDASMQSDVRAIAQQMESYAANERSYPDSITVAVGSPTRHGPGQDQPGKRLHRHGRCD